MFDLVYSGFDKLDVAFMGALPVDALNTLRAAKERAQKDNEPQWVELGKGRVGGHVHERGLKGGYAFRFDTGSIGANFFFKESPDINQWNVFVSSKSSGLLAFGYEGYRDNILQTLNDMGAIIRQESLNRVDYAMDFKTTEFELNPYQFVAPPKCRMRINPNERENQFDWEGRPDEWVPSVIMSGRRVETVTIGKMPGRQVCVYDKGREVTQRRKLHWYEAWGLDPKDKTQKVWRVELRVGKHYLSQIYGLKTFRDLDDSIGDVFGKLATDMRYIEDKQTDTNVTRAAVHPLWSATRAALDAKLTDHRSGLLPGRIIEIERERQREIFQQNIVGNALGVAAIDGMDEDTARLELDGIAARAVAAKLEDSSFQLGPKLKKRQEKYRFQSGEPKACGPL